MDSPLKVVLDTNILISALIFPGPAREFVFILLGENIQIIASDYIFREIEEVLKRNKFQDKKVLKSLFELIKKGVIFVKVNSYPQKIPLRDPKDHPIIQTAQKGKAKYLITGDEELLSLKTWRGIKIVKISQFRQLLLAKLT